MCSSCREDQPENCLRYCQHVVREGRLNQDVHKYKDGRMGVRRGLASFTDLGGKVVAEHG